LNDEADATQAIIYYNELQVKEIEVIININTLTCSELLITTITSTLTAKIKSLEKYKITIRGLTENKGYILQQKGITTIKGFTDVSIENLQINQKADNDQIGFTISHSSMNLITFNNVRFYRIPSTYFSNMLSFNFSYLDNQLSLIDTTFQGFSFNSKNLLFSIASSSTQSSKFDSFTFYFSNLQILDVGYFFYSHFSS